MNDYYSDIAAIANRSKEEVCGFLLNNKDGGLAMYQTRNVSPDARAESFEISLDDQRIFQGSGLVEAFFHSHVTGDEKFSQEDMRSSNASGLPLFVFAVETQRFNLYIPPTKRAAFYDRQFIAGLKDCYQLVADYLACKSGIVLPYVRRTATQLNFGIEGWKDLAAASSLRVSEPSAGYVKDDVLAFSTAGNTSVNHLAIYLGDGLMLHQLLGKPSSVKSLTEAWKNNLRFVCRA